MNRSLLRLFRSLCILMGFLCLSFAAPVWASPSAAFVPERPVMPVSRLRPGMRGHMLTVLRGTKPVKLPLEIVSVIPGAGSLKHTVMIRLLPAAENATARVAQGMSGSPVYIDGLLVGAVSVGWNFSDHKTALVTPIEEMCAIFSRPDRPVEIPKNRISFGPRSALMSTPLLVGGLSSAAVSHLGEVLGLPTESAPSGASGELPVEENSRLAPGDALAVLLAWGDVEMAATGTVTAVSRDGRFLAFGHPFMERGAVNFPAARAYVHDTVFSQMFPFKLASPTGLVGTVTQDRSAGVGGRAGYFTPAVSATLAFQDADAPGGGKRVEKKFRIIPDAFLGPRLLEGIYSGLVADQWGRRGQGTAKVTLCVEGAGVENGWARTNLFFAEDDVVAASLRECAAIIEYLMLQPFREIWPVGFRLDVSLTQEPKVLFIEDVLVSTDARPGEKLDVEVTLRPWRRSRVKKHFELTVPKEAAGICELQVRGGGVNSFSQLAVEGGWKAFDSLDRALKELNAIDANNELVVELIYDQAGGKNEQSSKKARAELLPEEKEFLSETKSRRIKDGTLSISRAEYVVEGMMKRLININDETD